MRLILLLIVGELHAQLVVEERLLQCDVPRLEFLFDAIDSAGVDPMMIVEYVPILQRWDGEPRSETLTVGMIGGVKLVSSEPGRRGIAARRVDQRLHAGGSREAGGSDRVVVGVPVDGPEVALQLPQIAHLAQVIRAGEADARLRRLGCIVDDGESAEISGVHGRVDA
ncbi:MAG: hypothetical protein FJW31_27850 [Acidobacteria bacterium]|nr:hypothetical protein [Acidobacteriota bacterium]